MDWLQVIFDVTAVFALVAQAAVNREQGRLNREVIGMFKTLRENRELRDALARRVEDDAVVFAMRPLPPGSPY